MRGKLLIGYRRNGVQHRHGEVIELSDEDRAILGRHVELIDDEEPDTLSDEAIDAVFAALDAEDPGRQSAWWTKDGRPDVFELERRGLVLSAAERDRHWARYRGA